MRLPRFKWSVRSLLTAIAVLAAVLGLAIRFGPHIIWKTVHSDTANEVFPIPSRPLTDTQPDEELAICSVGPISFELPRVICSNLDVREGLFTSYLSFHSSDRSLSVLLPRPDYTSLSIQNEISEFAPDSRLTFPRLFKEIADAQSSDFSFGMTHRELRWHKWLLKNHPGPIDVTIEYLWLDDLEGVLRTARTNPGRHVFQWSTVDCNWQGSIHFRSSTPDDRDWVRHVCATFAINGDPKVLQGRDDVELKSMVQLSAK